MKPGNSHHGECPECAPLLTRYECLTFEQARIHNSLEIVKLLGDQAATKSLTLQAYRITADRESARRSLLQHKSDAHELRPAA